MAILPLPQFEADLKELQDERDRAAYEALSAPKTIVVRYGFMKMIGEFPYQGEAKPGCGSKMVVETFRGTEIGEMLTSTCPNAGCSKSVTRKEMLEYIENSGGRQYPFATKGRVLRVATAEDVRAQEELTEQASELRRLAKRRAQALDPDLRIVEVERILGDEVTTIYYASEERRDTRALEQELRGRVPGRIECKQVGARDEARLTADYERCGQYCCCKNFLKVLKPVSMRSAKTQKATLDPLKISGRCGRLMCCLRYEDQTYEDLRKRLPKRKKKVGTPEGDGIVIDTQILTQLVLVALEGTTRRVAVPVEEITEPTGKIAVEIETRPRRGIRSRDEDKPEPDRKRDDRPPRDDRSAGDAGEDGAPKKKRRRRRR
ncbi:MAG: regulatory iron-sulfur-containing complex subunit RicT [Phycisphaerales bacterium JB037]